MCSLRQDEWVCTRYHDLIISDTLFTLIVRLGITALAVDNTRGYVLVALNDRQRHMHVIDLWNEVRLSPGLPSLVLILLLKAMIHKFTGHSDQISSIICIEHAGRYVTTSWDR